MLLDFLGGLGAAVVGGLEGRGRGEGRLGVEGVCDGWHVGLRRVGDMCKGDKVERKGKGKEKGGEVLASRWLIMTVFVFLLGGIALPIRFLSVPHLESCCCCCCCCTD